ncbi:hypothetical protein EXU29_13060 [Acinetobacter wuhouensis]|uniref:hypothetical protein n=1 Tax=Acinetobacter wuhouensis TaxID=1879050 RepID=UPI0010232E68|nr:hypothetical protein [Acinetobacter wuhouensis]RZG71562.1 hypothetical protein EXU29_13060 [Acinetobacter wuhouensis]
MFKRHKEIDRKVDELVAELYEVEGEIVDFLTHQMFDSYKKIKDNKFKELQSERNGNGTSIIRFLSEEVCDDILQFDSELFYSDYVILKLKSRVGDNHYFFTRFSHFTFSCHDIVRLIALPQRDKKYDEVYAAVNIENTLLWTGMERGRIGSLKLGFGMVFGFMFWQTIFITFIFLFFLFLSWITNDFDGLLETFTIAIMGSNICILIIGLLLVGFWWIFSAEEDYQANIYAEAIFKKLGFNAVKYLDLEKYSLLAFNKKRNVEVDYFEINKQARIYLFDIALREHNQKYSE